MIIQENKGLTPNYDTNLDYKDNEDGGSGNSSDRDSDSDSENDNNYDEDERDSRYDSRNNGEECETLNPKRGGDEEEEDEDIEQYDSSDNEDWLYIYLKYAIEICKYTL